MSPLNSLHRSPCPLLFSWFPSVFVAAVCFAGLCTSISGQERESSKVGSPRHQVMQEMLAAFQNMNYEEVRELLGESRGHVDHLSFDPLTAEYFDRIRTKLQLTEEELDLYRKQGFVSVDHDQQYSFGSAYYDIYSSHLPVLITSDSVLHAMHRSFDDLLAELELTVLAPQLQVLLEKAHESLPGEERAQGLRESFYDVDLYLCIARNLLAGTPKDGKHDESSSLAISSKFGQDEMAGTILELIDAGRVQIPGREGTRIYGGNRAIDYSQFIVRGHYTKHPTLQAYFRCMMWLSRADCGWFVQPADPVTLIENDPVRELTNACLLALSLRESGQWAEFESINRLLSHFASQDDNLSARTLAYLLEENGIREVADLSDSERLMRVFNSVGQSGLGTQMIRSQAMFVDNVSYTVEPPSVFQLFGQKFVLDSFILSNVVYDSIIFQNRKVKRYMPMGLDVMAALGNDEAWLLLEPELRRYNYSGNLWAASRFVEQCSREFWQRDLYNSWLSSIRELDIDLSNEVNVPESMKTAAWQRKQLQTQLASWAEFRHDMVLYAKQSYTGVPGCEYPDAYIEPYPEFYKKLRGFAEALRTALIDYPAVEVAADSQWMATRSKQLREQRITYIGRVIEILSELEAIARRELSGEELTEQQSRFLQQTIDRRGSLPLGSGTRPRYDGWYCDLFYDRNDSREWDPTIIDVHTFPDPFSEPVVLEVGVGNTNLGVIAVNCNGTIKAYVGPLYSYYEFQHPANDRLSDAQWMSMVAGPGKRKSTRLPALGPSNQNVSSRSLPDRPAWTREFQAPAKKRTIENFSVSVLNGRIRLVHTQDNQPPKTEQFAATDAGVADFVDYVIQQQLEHRWSLDLTRVNISPRVLDDLRRLERLAFVQLPFAVVKDPAVEQFRIDRPDIEVRPGKLAISRAVICESVSGYNSITEKPDATVAPGETFPVYLEFRGACVRSKRFGGAFTNNVSIEFSIVNGEGRVLQRHSASDLVQETLEYPRWTYRAPFFELASDVPHGKYHVEVEISDLCHPDQPTVSARLPLVVSDSGSR